MQIRSGLMAGFICSLLAWQPLQAKDVLRVLAWPGYADVDVVQTFEKRFQVDVEVTFVDSDEMLWDKMHAQHGPQYDVVAANTAEMQRYFAAGLLKPLNPAWLPNTRHQLPRFRHWAAIPGLQQQGRLYAIPFTYSTMGIIYDKRQFATPPDSMNVLWDPRYRHKVLDFNSAQHNFSFAALASGIDHPFQLSAAQQKMLVQRLVDLRRNVLTYYSLPEEATELFIQHRIALMFGNYGTQQLNSLRLAGADVGYAIPREGVLAWLDCWAMTVAASKPQLAQQWINYMLEPEVSRLLPLRQGLADTLTASGELQATARVLWLQPVENAGQREALWQKIISGNRPGNI
ncbi:MAG: extracellular solute-binding protein [Aquitalea sp.]|nr:extracellular solute-binding protein [Aquitalea sp.]